MRVYDFVLEPDGVIRAVMEPDRISGFRNRRGRRLGTPTMGLDLIPENGWDEARASISYSGPHGFRTWLCDVYGFEFEEMEGVGGDRPWDDVWFTQEVMDLVPLLNHSDCDGYMDVADAERVLGVLASIADRIEVGNVETLQTDFYKPFIEDLLVVLEECIRSNRRVEFS